MYHAVRLNGAGIWEKGIESSGHPDRVFAPIGIRPYEFGWPDGGEFNRRRAEIGRQFFIRLKTKAKFNF
jgi:hypothetical protein